jgi:hypothetical protein
VQATRRQPCAGQRSPDGASLHYGPHRPEQTTLYRLMQQHAASLTAHTEASTASELPRFIKKEFEALLKCGILAHGLPTVLSKILAGGWGVSRHARVRQVTRTAIARRMQTWSAST